MPQYEEVPQTDFINFLNKKSLLTTHCEDDKYIYYLDNGAIVGRKTIGQIKEIIKYYIAI